MESVYKYSGFTEEEDGGVIKVSDIKKAIKKHGGYTTPEYNDILYLHYGSFTKIENLDPFINLKALWLNNNAISKIENLGNLKNLTCLYLQQNIISEMSGLEELVNLKVLCLSHNFISKVEGLNGLKNLTNLDLDHNRLRDPSNLSGLLEAHELTCLNLSDNNIESEEFASIIKELHKLRVLRMGGNMVTRTMDNYRRRLITQNKELKYLDDAPIEEDDRRIAEAWAEGGREAELKERKRIKDEKNQKHKKQMKEFKKLQRDAILKAGQSLEDHPDLVSSDSEDKPDVAIPETQDSDDNFFVTEGNEEVKVIDAATPKDVSSLPSHIAVHDVQTQELIKQIDNDMQFEEEFSEVLDKVQIASVDIDNLTSLD